MKHELLLILHTTQSPHNVDTYHHVYLLRDDRLELINALSDDYVPKLLYTEDLDPFQRLDLYLRLQLTARALMEDYTYDPDEHYIFFSPSRGFYLREKQGEGTLDINLLTYDYNVRVHNVTREEARRSYVSLQLHGRTCVLPIPTNDELPPTPSPSLSSPPLRNP